MLKRILLATALGVAFATPALANERQLDGAEILTTVSGTKADVLGGTAWFDANKVFHHSSGFKGKWWIERNMLCTDGRSGGCNIISKKADGTLTFRKERGGSAQTVVFVRQSAAK